MPPPFIRTAEGFDRSGEGSGQFGDGGVRFIGFEFNNGGGDQYGWARIELKNQGIRYHFTLVDYAYGDIGDQVRAGELSRVNLRLYRRLVGLRSGRLDCWLGDAAGRLSVPAGTNRGGRRLACFCPPESSR
jgi:hypothetical protein